MKDNSGVFVEKYKNCNQNLYQNMRQEMLFNANINQLGIINYSLKNNK